jgi:hypothetical protein
MATKQYVQHISGQGEKWEVSKEWPESWFIEADEENLQLPKSEYVLCEPSVVWKDVTEECEVNESGWITHHDRLTTQDNGYRRRKVQLPHGECQYHQAQWFIIIEQKVTD